MVTENVTLLIDPLADDRLWGLSISDLLVPIGVERESAAILVSHLHGDHFDPVAIGAALASDGAVICSEAVAATVASRGYAVDPVRLFEPRTIADVTVVALPAVDGFGIVQVSWLVIAPGLRLLHGGDTLWHGHWWDIARSCGGLDVAFLPINGFRYRGRGPDVDVPSSLTPEQAVAAARVLGADRMVPIHYGLEAPFYAEEPDAESRLVATAVEERQSVDLVAAGEWLSFP